MNKEDSFQIVYKDFNRKKTERTISDIDISDFGTENTFTAFCHLRNERRHFVVGRFVSIIDLKTGKNVDPMELLKLANS